MTAAAVSPSEPTPDEGGDGIERLFDVGGHDLHLHCEGSGFPTIVYLHGATNQQFFSGASSADEIQSMLASKYRFCSYDRRNIGNSDEVPGVISTMTRTAHRSNSTTSLSTRTRTRSTRRTSR